VAAFSPDGRWLVEVSSGGNVQIWDGRTLADRGSVTSGFDPSSISFSCDSRILGVAGNSDPTGAGIANRLAFWALPPQSRLDLLASAATNAAFVCFGRRTDIVAIGYNGGEVRIWDYASRRLLMEFTEQHARIWHMAFSPDDHWLAAGDLVGGLVFYDLPQRRALPSSVESSLWVLGLAFAPDGRTLASAEEDGVIRLWCVATRRCALELSGHMGMASKVAFSPDGNTLVSGGADGTVRRWPAE
jgi:WD40 repeat protein